VASLLFLTTATGGTQNMTLSSFGIGAVRLSLPLSNNLIFNNSGNTQATPQGQLTLYSPTNKIIGTTVVNHNSGMVLPDSPGLFETNLSVQSNRFAMPGMYKLELQYKDSLSTKFTTLDYKFIYLNLWVIVPLLLILTVLIWIFKYCTSKVTKRMRRQQRQDFSS
jgi:hypothetical protein